jgi:hypothetical protein
VVKIDGFLIKVRERASRFVLIAAVLGVIAFPGAVRAEACGVDLVSHTARRNADAGQIM